MTIVVVDFFCAILFVAGITIALRGARAARGGEQGSPPPATYITRIAGTMMAVFALALATMMTVFALSSS
jgi:hypothetical protein